MDWIEHKETDGTPLLPAVRQQIRQIGRGVGMNVSSFEEVLREQESLILDAQIAVIESQSASLCEQAAQVVESADVELRRAFRTRNRWAVRQLSEDLIALRQGADDVDA